MFCLVLVILIEFLASNLGLEDRVSRLSRFAGLLSFVYLSLCLGVWVLGD